MPRREVVRKVCKYCFDEFEAAYQQRNRQIRCFKLECKKAHKFFLNNKAAAKLLRLENTRIWKSQAENKARMRWQSHEYYVKNKEKYWCKNIKE